jgi:uncharacterized protein YecT (DUF1311 family)
MTTKQILTALTITGVTIVATFFLVFHSDLYAEDQSEQNQRMRARFEELQKELDSVFRKALDAETTEAAKEALIASQRAWQLYCDAEGHYEFVSTGPASARTSNVNGRMIHLILMRIYHLQTPYAQGWINPYSNKK